MGVGVYHGYYMHLFIFTLLIMVRRRNKYELRIAGSNKYLISIPLTIPT